MGKNGILPLQRFCSTLNHCLLKVDANHQVISISGALSYYTKTTEQKWIGRQLTDFLSALGMPSLQIDTNDIQFERLLLADNKEHLVGLQLLYSTANNLTKDLLLMDTSRTFEKLYTLENIIQVVPGSLFWKDPQGRYLGCNDFVVKLAGLSSANELIGKTDFDLFPKDLAEEWIVNDQHVLQTQQTVAVEETVRFPNGKDRIYAAVKSPLYNWEGKLIGVLGNSVDITEQKNLEESLEASKIREAHFKAMSAVGGIIAHELRTPLSSIELNAQSVQEYFPMLVEAYRAYSEMTHEQKIHKQHLKDLGQIGHDIERSARYASNTITTILAGFHHSSSQVPTIKAIKLNKLVQQVLNDYSLDEQERALITFQPTESVRVLGAPSIITHVLNNLLKNALYAIKKAGKGNITIFIEKKADHIYLNFKDTGEGIPENILEHIFEPFYTTKDQETSVGLGLYFCKIALEKMDASINCKSELGKYTIFSIKLKVFPLN